MAKKKPVVSGPRPRNDAYTVMLFATFMAILTGCVLMYLDASEYGDAPPPTTNLSVPKLGGGPDTAAPKTGL